MARVNYVKKAQKPQGRCEKCGKELPAGSAYKWCAPRAGKFAQGFRRKRCLDCPTWRPSETTSSPARSAVYGAQEAAEDALVAWDRQGADDLRSILLAAAEGVREGAQVYREGQENIESGFGHSTYVSDELGEKADTLESAAEELESAADDIEEWEGEDDAKAEYLSGVTVFVVVNKHDGSLVNEEQVFESDADADLFMEALVRDGLAKLDEVEIEEQAADDYDIAMLPESVRDGLEEAIEEARDAWADDQLSKAEDALANVEIP